MTDPLIAELDRLGRVTASSRSELIALIDDVEAVKRRLVTARDTVGAELRTVQRGILACNAYGYPARRASR